MMAADRKMSGGRSLLGRLLLALYDYLPLPVYFGLWLAHLASPGGRSSLEARLAVRSLPPRGRRAIWFHAASVGEISTIAPVVTEVSRVLPGVPAVVTTMTPGGSRRAAEKLEHVEIVLAPFDFFPAVRRFVAAIEPACLIIGETELWPNMIREAKRQGATVVLVNGRISDKSYSRYKAVSFFIGTVLKNFDLLLMRTEVDGRRIIELGAPADRVEVQGNTKYDVLPAPIPIARRRQLRDALGFPGQAKIVTLGSAREGESEMVLGALAEWARAADVRLVIAPRHLRLVPEIERASRGLGYDTLVVSDLDRPGNVGTSEPQVLILAQMGRLLEVYAISDVAIVGGTLKPFGGHNPLEPASQGCATVVGPYAQNIKDDMDYLISRSGALVVKELELGPVVASILAEDERRQSMGLAAARAVEDNKGIAQRCVQAMLRRKLLPRV